MEKMLPKLFHISEFNLFLFIYFSIERAVF